LTTTVACVVDGFVLLVTETDTADGNVPGTADRYAMLLACAEREPVMPVAPEVMRGARAFDTTIPAGGSSMTFSSGPEGFFSEQAMNAIASRTGDAARASFFIWHLRVSCTGAIVCSVHVGLRILPVKTDKEVGNAQKRVLSATLDTHRQPLISSRPSLISCEISRGSAGLEAVSAARPAPLIF
jgi:hypothetical protein